MKMANPDYKTARTIHEFIVRDITGKEVKLDAYRGHVCVIVNVASQCMLAEHNYKHFNELYDKYSDTKGLRILAFPCNQFGGLEPGDNDKIASFVSECNVKFDVFEKVEVNGDTAHPLWKFLKLKQRGTLGNIIKWNFTKFIVDKTGDPVERHGSDIDPLDLVKRLDNYW